MHALQNFLFMYMETLRIKYNLFSVGANRGNMGIWKYFKINLKNFKCLLFPKMQKWKWSNVAAAAGYKRRLGFVGLVCPVMFK